MSVGILDQQLVLEDAEPALQPVFAFIDSFDDLQLALDGLESPPPAASSPVKPAISPKPRVPAKLNRGAKKRALLQALRDEVAALEDQLVRTHKAQDPAAQQLDRSIRAWLASTRAREENRRRQDSEARNRQLKSVLLEQHQAARHIRHMLRAVTTYAKLEKALQTPLDGASSLRNYVPNFEDMILNELVMDMAQLRLDADSVFPSVGCRTGMTAFYNRLESKRDPETGITYVEASSSTTVGASMKQAGGDLQKFTTTLLTKHGALKVKGGMVKRSKTQLSDRTTTAVVNVRGMLQVLEDEQRMLFTMGSVVFQHPNDDTMRFREHAWMLLTPSPTDPEHRCVLRICYRLSPAVAASSGPPTLADKTREFVLQALGGHKSSFFSSIAEVVRVSDDVEAVADGGC